MFCIFLVIQVMPEGPLLFTCMKNSLVFVSMHLLLKYLKM